MMYNILWELQISDIKEQYFSIFKQPKQCFLEKIMDTVFRISKLTLKDQASKDLYREWFSEKVSEAHPPFFLEMQLPIRRHLLLSQANCSSGGESQSQSTEVDFPICLSLCSGRSAATGMGYWRIMKSNTGSLEQL